MRTFNLFYTRFRNHSTSHKYLYSLAVMLFFWAIFDGIMAYLTPLIIVQSGYSKTAMGFIISTSSMAGAFFDFVLSSFMHNSNFRRIYLVMFGFCLAFPIFLFSSHLIAFYVLAMVVWGLYWDLATFGNYDFVGRYSPKIEHAASFGVIDIFRMLGGIIAPILAGLIVLEKVGWPAFVLATIFLGISFCCYFALLKSVKGKTQNEEFRSKRVVHVNVLKELFVWERVGKMILPVMFFILIINIYDAFFWTIGPIFSESLKTIHPFGGLFMTFYFLPSMITGWFVGRFTVKHGKRKIAIVSFLTGSLVLSMISVFSNPIFVVFIVLVSSFLSAMAWPSLKGMFVDFISQSVNLEGEIEGLADFSGNLGYIIGPILAGVLADRLGNSMTFTVLGVGGVIAALSFSKLMPKRVRVDKS